VATQNGFKLRWDYEFIGCREDMDTGKVHSTIKDVLSGQELIVISNYICGADGARSVVARDVQLPFSDNPGGGFALNVWFEADLVLVSL
jgi:2-polyprenyl-6-methoxyphenol hydroxylase-like FAD-dependent oxidoreductase